MSDYVHEKVIRLPFPKEILKQNNTDDPWDCEGYLREKLGDLCDNNSGKHFKLEATDEAYYIDWVYYHTYGEESGDWGKVRLLTNKEIEVIKPYFDKLGIYYEDYDLRLVDYCYYNASEAPDYYNVDVSDESSKFL